MGAECVIAVAQSCVVFIMDSVFITVSAISMVWSSSANVCSVQNVCCDVTGMLAGASLQHCIAWPYGAQSVCQPRCNRKLGIMCRKLANAPKDTVQRFFMRFAAHEVVVIV